MWTNSGLIASQTFHLYDSRLEFNCIENSVWPNQIDKTSKRKLGYGSHCVLILITIKTNLYVNKDKQNSIQTLY